MTSGAVPRPTRVRDHHLDRLTTQKHDALIVGGGINVAISALALASHGSSVALIESEDFGSGVSQESSNLVWGGFKYLQTYERAMLETAETLENDPGVERAASLLFGPGPERPVSAANKSGSAAA